MTDEQSQQLLGNVQLYQQQLQGIAMQKETLNAQLLEINNALEELEKSKPKHVYKVTGPLLINTPTADVKTDLKEKQDMISTRMKLLEKSELKLKEKVDELREKLVKKAG